MSELLKGVLQGIVEGLTEFIPVSSTGHLILFGSAIGFEGPRADTFNVFIQSGAILAVVVLYWNRFLGFLDLSKRGGLSGIHGIGKLAIASLPALILGALLHEEIKIALFHPEPVAVALIAGGIALIAADRYVPVRDTTVDQVSYRESFWIGVYQCLALWPGISRAGATIIGGRVMKLSRHAAAEFSFLLAVPVILAAAGYDLLRSWSFLSLSDLPLFGLGFAVSFLTALAAIKLFIKLLHRFSLAAFGYYRIALGAAVLYWIK